jgi:YKOF-related Family
MDIGVEISLYPLNADYIPPIKSFIDRLNTEPRLRVVTNSLSTQVFGPYDVVFGTLTRELRTTFETADKAVFVMKVIGPLAGT